MIVVAWSDPEVTVVSNVGRGLRGVTGWAAEGRALRGVSAGGTKSVELSRGRAASVRAAGVPAVRGGLDCSVVAWVAWL